MAIKPVKKLTVAALYPQLKETIKAFRKLEKPPTSPTFIGRVAGIVRKVNVKTHAEYGDSWQFVGEFVGNDVAGNTLMSSTCYLPTVIADLLAAPFFGENAAENDAVEFGVDLFIRFDETVAVGYRFEVEMLTPVKNSDPLAALVSTLSPLALPTPAEEQQSLPLTAGEAMMAGATEAVKLAAEPTTPETATKAKK